MPSTRNYLILIGAHVLLAIAVFVLPFLSNVLALLLAVVGFLFIIKSGNRNNQALLAAAYITGFEVFIRATGGGFFYEYGKYAVMLMLITGIFLSGFARNIFPYLLYLLLLLPSLYYASTNFLVTESDRKTMVFVLSGPVCLGISAIYCYGRRVTLDDIYAILLAVGLPIISLTTYLILFNPSVRDVVTGTDSSTATSGGFGPNQVSTMVGLGIFIFLSRVILNSTNKMMLAVNIAIASVMAYRGVVTFSRGGIFTAVAMIIVFLFILYRLLNAEGKFKASILAIVIFFGALVVWGYSVLQTNGLIEKRYAGKDALGRAKTSQFSGREQLASTELKIFYENPLIGCGVGRSKKIREEETGIVAASHNEITRLLAEHGFLGILILLILIIVPFLTFFTNRRHLFLVPFVAFWLLTINHAAMRIAAPAFLYALSLLKVVAPISKTDIEVSESELEC